MELLEVLGELPVEGVFVVFVEIHHVHDVLGLKLRNVQILIHLLDMGQGGYLLEPLVVPIKPL